MMSKIDVGQLSERQEVAFGTSGVRGLVKDLTSELCFAYVSSFLTNICPHSSQAALGIDLRPSSPSIAKACIAAAEAIGVEIIYCGELPTPALAFFAIQMNIPAVMVTGSHIPFDRNGIKFYKNDGEISKSDEAVIMSGKVLVLNDLESRLLEMKLPLVDTRAINLFEKRYKDIFPPDMLAGKRVGVYEHSSVARDFLKTILKSFGATIVSLERTETFVPIDTEAVSKDDQEKALFWSEEYNLDAIVSTDGDGDRPLIASEKGEWLRGDILGILCSDYLKATHVVVPINANSALEISDPNRLCVRTKIGSPYVIEEINNLLLLSDPLSRIVGYEANGGFLVGNSFNFNHVILSRLPTRDSILPILLIFAMSYESGLNISQLSLHLPSRYTSSGRVQNVSLKLSGKIINYLKESKAQQNVFLQFFFKENEMVSIVSIDETDGLRMKLNSGDVIHLRPSGNAPELRCYVESGSVSRANHLIKKIIALLEKLSLEPTLFDFS